MRRVLVVEDQEEMREVWSDFLRHLGHDVRPAASVAEARALIEGGLAPDVAIVDWTLPDGSADAVLDALAPGLDGSTGAAPCTIAVATGHGEDVTDAVRGRATVLRKPFPLKELARLVGPGR